MINFDKEARTLTVDTDDVNEMARSELLAQISRAVKMSLESQMIWVDMELFELPPSVAEIDGHSVRRVVFNSRGGLVDFINILVRGNVGYVSQLTTPKEYSAKDAVEIFSELVEKFNGKSHEH